MTKEIVKKILNPRNPLRADDVSVDEKQVLMKFFVEKGFTASTFYLRFFQKGFFLWEILGVKDCKKQFLELPDVAKQLLEYIDPEDEKSLPGNKGYLYMLAQSDVPGQFYKCIKKANAGLCRQFFDFMGERGMCSTTVIKRFSSDDWKDWEMTGVRDLLEIYQHECGNG